MTPTDRPPIEVDPSIYRHLADAQVNVELDTGDMILNLGPQHPATHGTLRLVGRFRHRDRSCFVPGGSVRLIA